MSERVLLIGVGSMGRPYLGELVARGAQVRVVECEPRAAALRAEGLDVVTSAGATEEQFIAASLAAAADFQPTAAIPFAEPHVLAAAWIQQEFGLIGPGFGAALASRNKAMQRVLLDQAGVAQPAFIFTSDLAEAAAFRERHALVVVKGLRGSGSRCVRLVATETELAQALRALNQTEPVLIEEFVAGPEYSAELLVADGTVRFVNLTSKVTSGGPEFVEIGHIVPTPAGELAGIEIQSFLRAVVDGLGVRTSLVHLEFLVRDNRPYLVEVALRTPGDHILELIGVAYGFSVYGAVIDLFTGRQPEIDAGEGDGGERDAGARDAGERRVAAVHYLRPRPGVITMLGDISVLIRNAAVQRFDYPYRIGDTVSPLRSSRDRAGYVILNADTHDDAAQHWRGLAPVLEPLTSQPGLLPAAGGCLTHRYARGRRTQPKP